MNVWVEEDIPHLAGPAAAVRQAIAAHFVRGCRNVLEIGGHRMPVTPYLVGPHDQVVSIDPKTEPFEADTLNGWPCRVRHVAQKFQDVDIDLPRRSYGLVLLGLSLKPAAHHAAVDQVLLDLVDGAALVVVDYALQLERATTQAPAIIGRPGFTTLCRLDMDLDDASIRQSPYHRRRFVVLAPAGEG